jgi:hypothetical protein
VPKGRYERDGFGLYMVAEKEWSLRVAAVEAVAEAFASTELPEARPDLREKLSIVKGMFSRIAIGDIWDWYTTSRTLGHPSAELSLRMSKRIAIAREAIKAADRGIFRGGGRKGQGRPRPRHA